MIAFTRELAGARFELWVKLVGGGEPLLLDEGSQRWYVPCWSPDGLEIAFVRCVSSSEMSSDQIVKWG